MILINKQNISAVLPAVSDQQNSRYTMSGIHVTEQFTEATNGHIAIRLSLPTASKPENFPKVEGFVANGFQSGFLGLDAAKQIEKAIPKVKHLPVLNHAAISRDPDGQLKVAVTDLDNPQVFAPRSVTGPAFPNLDQVFPKVADAKFAVSLNPDYLAALANSAKRSGANSVKLSYYGPMSAVRLDAKADGQTWTAVIMPMRD